MRNHFGLDCIMVTAGCWLLSLQNDQITQIGLFPFLHPYTNKLCTILWQSPQLFASYDSGLISNGQFSFERLISPCLKKKRPINGLDDAAACLLKQRSVATLSECPSASTTSTSTKANNKTTTSEFCDIVAATVFHKTLTFRSTGLRLSWQQYKTTTL